MSTAEKMEMSCAGPYHCEIWQCSICKKFWQDERARIESFERTVTAYERAVAAYDDRSTLRHWIWPVIGLGCVLASACLMIGLIVGFWVWVLR